MGLMGLIHIFQHPSAVWTTGAAEFQTEQERRKNTHESPPQTQLTTGDVEAGAKLREGRGREAFGEDVRELGGGGNMKDPHLADGNPITDKV
jgi:hypothetical protein